VYYYDFYESPYGQMLLVAGDKGLSGAHFEGEKHFPAIAPEWRRDTENAVLREAAREFAQYFAGKRKTFDLPLAPEGSAFQQSIWQAISTVPFGQTITYGELTQRAGYAKTAIRAAGGATGRNPLTIIVPCHRIVGANGSLTGYAGGLDRKRALLALESGIRDLLSVAA
jgi:methylated-DNA-[protein]-cysteine S-methyltransferase